MLAEAHEHPGNTAISELSTPCLLLDRAKMRRNIQRLSDHIGGLGGTIRPHVKTHKSINVAREVIAGGNVSGITVSTLKEAEYFFENSIADIFYAVGIAPNKFRTAAQLIKAGCDLKITLDSVEMAEQLAAFAADQVAADADFSFPVLIELDTDGHRSGTDPDSDELLAIGRVLAESAGCELRGVMTHAGESYACDTPESQLAIARQERDRTVLAAERLRSAGMDCPVVSVGSTPTAFAIDDLSGITEVRAGVYTFFDLVMAGIGVCDIDDIAVSVLVSVTGYQKDKGWVITDGGWMAMSRDRGTEKQAVDHGYGVVLDADGAPLEGFLVSGANQEHGIISRRDSTQPVEFATMPLGSLLRVLPNHACATVGQYDTLHVVDGPDVVARWGRTSGW
ncbi:MAG: alanine racemase [Pseudomonadota bacterium]